ncbi:MAG: LacI family DNA-binding transcriptional regulator [Kineosporiaceae bacterium]
MVSWRGTTLRSVAEAAGVSTATVSKVLNNRPDVAPATRARVQRLLQQQNYRPLSGRPGGGSVVIDLIFTALDSPWAIEIIRGVAASEVEAVVSAVSDSPDPQRWHEHLLGSGRSGAVLVTSGLTAEQVTAFADAGVPCVVIDPVDLPGSEVPSVGATNWAGGMDATRHLLDLGHRRIGVVGGLPHLLCSRARIDGYRAALETAGLEVDPTLVRHGDFHHQGGLDRARELLALPDRPTAIFAGSDVQALGVVEAARELGLDVPGDLSIVGFDDLPLARWVSPPLTTVRQPLADMGHTAVAMLTELMAGRPLRSNRVELSTELVVRGSTAPPR